MEKPIVKPEQGRRLKECIRYRNRTQKWLAEKSHISQQTISSIINGNARLTEQNALLFSKALDIRLEYLLLESDYITSEKKAFERHDLISERKNLYLQILQLHGYELITTVSELEKVSTDPYFINQWVIDDGRSRSISLHHVNYERARIFFLYDTKIKKLSPPILMSDFMKMIDDTDYHFKCSIEMPFRKHQEMLEYSIPISGNHKI